MSLRPSRREFAAWLLAAPALAACRGDGVPALPDGELLTPGKAAGHRLRDGGAAPTVRIPDNRWTTCDVAVIGAGVAGLSAAWWLDRAGVKDVRVLELDRVPGGTAQSGTSPLTPYPWGAHYIVAPLQHQTSLIALLSELGAVDGRDAAGDPVIAEQLRVREPEERVFYRGRWYDGQYLHAGASADDHRQLGRFRAEIDRWVAWRDAAGKKAFALPASAASTDAEVTSLDRLSFGAWLDSLSLSSSRLRWLCDYACRDDYGLSLADTSAWAGISYFASRLAHPGAEHQPVVTWPEGNGALIAHLAATLGPRLLLEHTVLDVRIPDMGTGSGVASPRTVVSPDAPGRYSAEVVAHAPDGLIGLRARRVIVAIPAFVARRILAPVREGVRTLPAIDRGAWAVANLHLDGRLALPAGNAPLAWDNVLHDSPSLGYVVATHQRGRDHGPTVLTWYYPFTGDAAIARGQLDGATREDWAEVALADLSRAHRDLRRRCRRIDVCYWGHGMPRPRVGSVFDPALTAARTPIGPIHLAASELSGVALFEEALDHGVRAADEVLAALQESP